MNSIEVVVILTFGTISFCDNEHTVFMTAAMVNTSPHLSLYVPPQCFQLSQIPGENRVLLPLSNKAQW